MKKLLVILFVGAGLFISSNSIAQSKIKLGHIDFATLYSMMPGLDSVKVVFEKYNKE